MFLRNSESLNLRLCCFLIGGKTRSKSNAMIGDKSNDTKNQPTPFRPREFAATPTMIETVTQRTTTVSPSKSFNSRCRSVHLPQPEGESKRSFPTVGNCFIEN